MCKRCESMHLDVSARDRNLLNQGQCTCFCYCIEFCATELVTLHT